MKSGVIQLSGLGKCFGNVVAVAGFSLEIREAELLVLLGPSGCGKTTVLRMIAGLEVPDDGEIILGDRGWSKLPLQKRNIAMVFQNLALYPHRTVRRNIEYPLELRGIGPGERKTRTERIADLLGISVLLDRGPAQLSGGEAQRVALARALVREPSCFLMDEPLNSLDALLRIRARAEVKRIQQQLRVTTVYVTHDQEEAVALGDRIAIMDQGRLVQVGTPEALFRQPASVFVAGFLGRPPMNIFAGKVASTDPDGAMLELEAGTGGTFSLKASVVAGLTVGRKLRLGLRPDQIQVYEAAPWPATGQLVSVEIDFIEGVEPDFVAHCQSPLGRILVRTRTKPGYGAARLLFDPAKIHYFDAEDGKRIQ